MGGAIRRFGRALLVLGVSWAGGPRPAGAQPAAGPPPRPRFVGVSGHVINIDQISFVEQLGRPDDRGRTEVYFAGRPQPLLLSGEAGKQLVAALRDANGIAAPAGRAEAPTPGAGAALYDGFDGRLALDWKQVRLDPTHLSLASRPGHLTITTQRGSIHGTPDGNEAGADFLARNLTLVANPLAPAADFAITTRVVGFTPLERYQQAGLIVYADDDNYVKFGYEYNWGAGAGQTFFGVAEAAGQPTHLPVESESGLKDYWLRLTRRGDAYEYATSLDGRAWRVHGVATWAGTPARVGLLAKNGGAGEAAELDAHFDFFELRANPTPAPGPTAGAPTAPPAAPR